MAITDHTRRVLWARSGNACAMCGVELVSDLVGGAGVSVIGEECHIVAQRPLGPRGDQDPPGGAIDGPANVVLLCRNHHRQIDETRAAFPVADLVALKRRHEDAVTKRRGAPPADRVELLDRLAADSAARCTQGWQALGVPRALAHELSDDPSVGDRVAQAVTRHQGPVTVLIGDVGVGKSLGGERLHRNAIAEARVDPDAPVPVWLRAQGLDGVGLRDAVDAAARALGVDHRRCGVALTVDGLDEAGPTGAVRLLSAARELVLASPGSRAVLSTRLMADVGNRDERVTVTPLDEEERHALIARFAAAHQAWLSGFPETVRDAARRPLFAVALGMALREGDPVRPEAPAGIVAGVVARALRGRAGALDDRLERVAVATLRSGGAAVRAADHVGPSELDALLESRLVVQESGSLRFPLILVAQWLASRALADGRLKVDALLTAPGDLELWRSPMALAVLSAPPRIVESLMRRLVGEHPAVASLVLDESTRQFGGVETDLVSWKAAADAVRDAAMTWIGGVGPIAAEVAPMDGGRLAPLGARVDGTRLWTAWYRGHEPRPEVFELGENDIASLFEVERRFGPAQGATPISSPAWPWHWARHELRGGLSGLLRDRALPVSGTALEPEALFGAARRLLGHDRDLRSLDVTKLLDPEHRLCVGDVYRHVWRPVPDSMRAALRRHLGADGRLADPVPGPGEGRPGTWVWSDYAPEEVLARAVAAGEMALAAYEQYAHGLFAAFAPRLRTAATLPARLHIDVHMSASPIDERGPSFPVARAAAVRRAVARRRPAQPGRPAGLGRHQRRGRPAQGAAFGRSALALGERPHLVRRRAVRRVPRRPADL